MRMEAAVTRFSLSALLCGGLTSQLPRPRPEAPDICLWATPPADISTAVDVTRPYVAWLDIIPHDRSEHSPTPRM